MRILLVDDEPLSLKALSGFLTHQLGHEVTECGDSAEALKRYQQQPYHLVISDIRLPGIDGIELTQAIKKAPGSQFTDVVLITGYGSMGSAIKALRAGAYDYLLKPVEVEDLAAIVGRVEEHIALRRENQELLRHFDEKVNQATSRVLEQYEHIKDAYHRIIGVGQIGIFSAKMEEIKEVCDKLHQDSQLTVLIEGETGTGKEVVARMIHYGQGDVTTPFISINCSAIPANLVETELFGYDEGAFTDARKKGTIGKMDLARKGTLFLDEIGDLPLQVQPKLLRVLEERAFYRVGGLKKIQLDSRVICATNHNLTQRVRDGLFREDLYYRLKVGYIKIPPLRSRKDAILPLAHLFLEQFSQRKKKRFSRIHPDAGTILKNHDWPGNVRELQNTIERAVLLFDGTVVEPGHLSFLQEETRPSTDGVACGSADALEGGIFALPEDGLDLKEWEARIVRTALKRFQGNKTQTANYLGITRSALRSKLK